ncbi:T9SS type A sorting domain-containing protein [bacterium]|nr:T9SS type A sorting domain-containing protein [bacterium]
MIAGPIYSSVTLGDIDNDDTLEVIVAGDDRTLHAWSHDGTPLDSFPRDLTMETRSTAAVADIDPAYPGNEIVILSGDSRVFAFHGDGTTVPGFPALTPWVDWVSSSVAIADVNRDRKLEIVACNKKGIYVLNAGGGVLPGWPVMHDGIAIASPAIGDIDGNGYPDIVAAIGTSVYAYHYNGTLMSGFPVQVSHQEAVQSSPALADVDRDGRQEILIGSPDGALYCIAGNGSVMGGYPVTIGGSIKSSPLVLVSGNTVPNDSRIYVGSDDCAINVVWSGFYGGTGAAWRMFHRDQSHGGADPALLSPIAANRSGGLLQDLYVYPNPARTAPVRIRYYLNEAARVDFKVFNTAGDLVREFSQDGQAAVDNEYVWDLENIATGLYFVRASAAGAGGSGYKLCKFAVVK